jgi:hypothetical protein
MIRIPAVPIVSLALAACAAAGTATPADDPIRGELRIVVISDLNSSYGSTDYEPEVHRAVALIRDRWRPDLVLAAGELPPHIEGFNGCVVRRDLPPGECGTREGPGREPAPPGGRGAE